MTGDCVRLGSTVKIRSLVAVTMSHSRVKGLATLALLKTLYDAKRDHIDLFEPLLLDAIQIFKLEAFTSEDCRAAFNGRHGILVPLPIMQTLLMRGVRRGHLRRSGGRFFPGSRAWPDLDIGKRRSEIEGQHTEIAHAFARYCADRGNEGFGVEKALARLLAFLEENQVAFILDEPQEDRLFSPPTLSARDSALAAGFITEVWLADDSMRGYLRRMLEGFVLQNALLLRDIGSPGRSLGRIDIILDTRFLFGALGMQGEADKRACVETLRLLRLAGAHLSVFDKTVAEMRRVLAACERHLATAEGMLTMRQSPLTRHLLGVRATPSDVRQASALIETGLGKLDVALRSVPKHRQEFTLDEVDLAKRMRGPRGHDNDERIAHDVDCTAAVLTLRGGHAAESWSDCRAVFATSTQQLVATVASWYRDGGERGVPPVANVSTLSTLAALGRPADAGDLPIHQLIALCCAALAPSEKLWSAFNSHLRKLAQDGTLATEEAVAVVADSFTSRALMEVEQRAGSPDPDAATLTEMVERVTRTHQAVAAQSIAEADARAAEAQKSAAALVAAAERQTAIAREGREDLIAALRRVAELFGAVVSWLSFGALSAAASAAAALTLYGLSPRSLFWREIAWAVEGVGALLALAITVFGGSLRAWRLGLAKALADWAWRLAARLLPAVGRLRDP